MKRIMNVIFLCSILVVFAGYNRKVQTVELRSSLVRNSGSEYSERDRTESAPAEQARYVSYTDFGAVGNGVTDDLDAIIKAHSYANANRLGVRADDNATYYIGGANRTVQVQTDTDWGNAKFIIDDTKVENRRSQIFDVTSRLKPVQLTQVKNLKKNQAKLDIHLENDCLAVVIDNNTIRYIREGLDQDNGHAQTDIFIVDRNGNIDMNAPILWDYDNISSIVAYPIDPDSLTIKGGRFTTVANQASSNYNYHSRGINIARSNVTLDNIYHEITGEGPTGAPYSGFVSINTCAKVTVKNSMFSGHKTYETIGSANLPVDMGSYDLSVDRSANVTFYNCRQINSINDTKLWGIFASDHSKNVIFDTVEFSRFDAHMGVANAWIRNSVLGHQGINAIGCGVFRVENTKILGSTIINLRSDYGSTWEGEIIIRNCEFLPRNGAQTDVTLIGGSYSGMHDFGYICYMPSKITFDGLTVIDANTPANYTGPKIFAVFNSKFIDDCYKEKYPYVLTKEVVIRNLRIQSGKAYKISNNAYMFRNVKITEEK